MPRMNRKTANCIVQSAGNTNLIQKFLALADGKEGLQKRKFMKGKKGFIYVAQSVQRFWYKKSTNEN